MQHGNTEAPSAKWETAHTDGENLIVHLDRTDPALHLAVIPREVIEDVTGTSEGPMAALEAAGRERVGRAVESAWARGEVREMWEVSGTGLRNIQLWVTREDFH